jgi:D-glycero-alpha-D-manno-heptose-7-phosphate kinase
VEIVTRSEAPAGAGLAGSSALNIALCAALARITGQRLNKEKLIDTAKDIEAALLGIPTGLQDYGAAVYGSAHAFSFPPGGMTREKMAASARLLSKRALLFYSGKSRSSGINNWEMFRRVIEKDRKALSLFARIADCAGRAADALRDKHMARFDKAVAEEWKARRKLFPAISTARIDEAIAAGKHAGAAAARICGAGGGGCFFLLADPDRHEAVTGAVERTGCRKLSFFLSNRGLKTYNNR